MPRKDRNNSFSYRTTPCTGSFPIDKVYAIVKAEFGRYRMPVVDLMQVQTKDPFKVLVTTILSSRTKDATTATAAKQLFGVVKTLNDLCNLDVSEIERLIFPVGFYKNKARFLSKLPEAIEREFAGCIPETVEELIRLPGVGRKTANLVVTVAFNKPGICVDVHVHRICNRLGYLETKTPFETEMTLRTILPKKYWITFNSFLVSFGQHTCKPVNPHCNICPIESYCQKRV